MKIDIEFVRFALAGIVADENQKLLLKLEEMIMSNITPTIQALTEKVRALKASNDSLTASAVEKDAQIASIQGQLTAAAQNAVDPADVQMLNDLLASLG